MDIFSQSQLALFQIEILEVFCRLGLAFGLAALSGLVYAYCRRGPLSKNQLIYGGIALSQIVAMILIVLSENLFYALGLFAALSIIRFRTPIKSVNDTVHLFLCIGIGIACGAGALKVATVSSTFILLVQFGYYYFRFDKADSGYLLKVLFDESRETLSQIEEVIGRNSTDFSVSQIHRLPSQKTERLYQVFPKRKGGVNSLASDVAELEFVSESLVFSTQTEIEI